MELTTFGFGGHGPSATNRTTPSPGGYNGGGSSGVTLPTPQDKVVKSLETE